MSNQPPDWLVKLVTDTLSPATKATIRDRVEEVLDMFENLLETEKADVTDWSPQFEPAEPKDHMVLIDMTQEHQQPRCMGPMTETEAWARTSLPGAHVTVYKICEARPRRDDDPPHDQEQS